MKLFAVAVIQSPGKMLVIEQFRVDGGTVMLNCGGETRTRKTRINDDGLWDEFRQLVAELADCDAEDLGSVISSCERLP
jgi:hypothetical protein